MRLHLNGELREAPDLATLADLARWLELPSFGSAIELNGEVIRRADHPATPLKEGDRLEVVRLVGGG
ncbi:MAG: sulfur carrier protein ThiS [Geothrix sp.]|uniref:Sulfur carrier protein ThiS n=1 Tax=Candidatus Geothrix odensensis TaxID=2954440 RepID=A0A936F3C7_9BACT|nr:sulfur carrier protein ThiS [Candidatus Geothrix odensensis]MBK8789446.1 sulfur carrier protein ThiS [Holophagaceae bacterium]MBP7616869.1 sulfur carrier protein ThiS [Geothrix sp.]MCC6513858.1 sulfur carrier protein ThiS [Geothrix sp.]